MKITPVTMVTDSPSELNHCDPGHRRQRAADIAQPVLERDDQRRTEQRPEQGAHATHQRHQDHQPDMVQYASLKVSKPSTSTFSDPASPAMPADNTKASSLKRSVS